MSRRKPKKPRAYHSPHRAAGAMRTREAIVEAAVRVHAQGITTLAAVAEEAGVSLPTVTKHFPTREDLFGACTQHAAVATEYPSPEAIAGIADARERVDRCVRETFHLHEQSFGLCWTGYRLADESPAMAGAMEAYEGLVAALADAMLSGLPGGVDESTRAFVRAVLGPLAYRGLRLGGGLTPDDAIISTTRALRRLLNIPE